MATIRNVHQRVIHAPPDAVGPLLDRLGGPDDVLWPGDSWTPMILDGPVAVGTRGGHGAVRYHVSDWEPGRRVRFAFHPAVGLDGYHEATVTPVDADRCALQHVIVAQPRGRMRLLWPLAVRWLHDAVVEDLLDNAEHAAAELTGTPAPTARTTWSLPVRVLRVLERPLIRKVAIPSEARAIRTAFVRDSDGEPWDFADAFAVERPPPSSTDPARWADAIFRQPPGWVAALMHLRNVLVRVVGIEQGDETAFATLAATDDEVLLGTDAGHLNFRASVLVQPRTVTVSTVVQINNRRGRLYMAVVRRVHPVVVRSMLRRAARRHRTPGSAEVTHTRSGS